MQNGKIILETKRLRLREMTQNDLDALCAILCDPDVMRAAYETPFTREGAQGWLERHLMRYKVYGFGLWAVVLKETGEMIGQCGLTWQDWKGTPLLELGYLFQKAHWGKGYAAEAAAACRDYAFTVLHEDAVHSMIRDTHTASQNVAKRLGMQPVDSEEKNFRNTDMIFMLYRTEKTDADLSAMLDFPHRNGV